MVLVMVLYSFDAFLRFGCIDCSDESCTLTHAVQQGPEEAACDLLATLDFKCGGTETNKVGRVWTAIEAKTVSGKASSPHGTNVPPGTIQSGSMGP